MRTAAVPRLMILGLLAPGIIGLGLHAEARADAGAVEGFFERHCYDCHSGQKPEAGLDLAVLSRDYSDPAVLRTFVRIHDRIAKGEMPPADAARPAEAEIAAVTEFLDTALHAADAARIGRTGRARLRRLTRVEFENTLQDLLALDRLDIQGLLPPDGHVAGYTKIADGLALSPTHLAAYAAAVEKALDAAIATRSMPPSVFKRRIYPAGLFKFGGNLADGNFVLLKDGQPDPALPLPGTTRDANGKPIQAYESEERKKLLAAIDLKKHEGPVGLLMPNQAGWEAAWNVAPVYAGRYRLRLSIWGFHIDHGKVGPVERSQAAVLRAHEEGRQQEGGRLLATFMAASLAPREHEITTWLDAHESIVFDPVSLRFEDLHHFRQRGGSSADYAGPGVSVDWFEVEGPLNESWPPASHRHLFGDLPIRPLAADAKVVPPRRDVIRQTPLYLPAYHTDLSPAERTPPLETVESSTPEEDARRLFATFLPRAFRRPVEPAEVEPYVALVAARLAAGECFEDAMRRAYVAILTSPEFLFHPPDKQPVGNGLYALASRLSYWLWNSPPDDPLLSAASDGSLGRPEVLRSHVDRLLADPKSERFITDFTNQWLELRRLEETNPDGTLYPEYSFLLHEGIAAEPRAFLRELIANDLPTTTLVEADFTMLTQRLAEHYGIPGVDGPDVRRVALGPESHRGGFLAQAAIHKVTANGTTTTPVKRGVWVMDRLFDEPAPPPPPGVAAVDPDTRGTTTIRELLAKHRNNAGCATCHAAIDPPGFALECFDPIGGYRTRYRSTDKGESPPPEAVARWEARYRLGPPVDASGELAGSHAFLGFDDFRQLVAADPRRLARSFTAHMVRYATGADLSYADRRTIDAIVASCAEGGYGVRSLIQAIAASELLPRPR